MSTDRYNAWQIEYFDPAIKHTMIPSDTLYIRRHLDETLTMAAYSSGERLLELGCGMGRYTAGLARRGLCPEGFDLSPKLLAYLKSALSGAYDIPLHCGDIERPPAHLEGQFDVVVGFFVLHHLYDLEKGIAGVARLLKPDGRMVFLEPNPFNPLYYAQIALTPRMKWRAEKGLLRMRAPVLQNAMRQAGFSRFSMTRFGFFPPFLSNRPWAHRSERLLERLPLWRFALPFQIFRGDRE